MAVENYCRLAALEHLIRAKRIGNLLPTDIGRRQGLARFVARYHPVDSAVALDTGRVLTYDLLGKDKIAVVIDLVQITCAMFVRAQIAHVYIVSGGGIAGRPVIWLVIPIALVHLKVRINGHDITGSHL